MKMKHHFITFKTGRKTILFGKGQTFHYSRTQTQLSQEDEEKIQSCKTEYDYYKLFQTDNYAREIVHQRM